MRLALFRSGLGRVAGWPGGLARARSVIARLSSRALIALAVAATAGALAIDTVRGDQQRIDDLYRDLAAASVSVGEDTLLPQIALNEFTSSWDTILATINGRSEYFSSNFITFQEHFPAARALHAATSPGNTVALIGEPDLYDAFKAASFTSFCAQGKAYTVVAAGVGPRGWIAIALDPDRTLGRAREHARQPVRVALLEVGASDLLAGHGGRGCAALPDASYAEAAQGTYGVQLVPRPEGRTAVGFTPVVGTSLSVVLEDDPEYREGLVRGRRAAIVAAGALSLSLALLLLRRRRAAERLEA